MQSFFVFNAPPEPFRVLLGATGTTHIEVSRACSVYWVTGQPGPQVGNTISYGVNTAIQDGAGSPIVDTTLNTYMIVAFQEDTTQFWLLPEIDYSALDTILAETPFASGEKHWGILAYVQGTQVYIPPQIWVPRMKAEGDLLINHSTADPTDPTTPPTPTVLPIQRTGASTPKVGQFLQVMPDADDPTVATSHTADPAWTELALTEGMIIAWKHDSSGILKAVALSIGTDHQILTVKPDTGAFTSGGGTTTSLEPSWQGVAYALMSILLHEGGMIYAHSSGDPTITPPMATELQVGGVGQLLQVLKDSTDPAQSTNNSKDPAWTTMTITEGMIAAWKIDNAGTRKLFEVPIGADGDILTAWPDPNAYDDTGTSTHQTRREPTWKNIRYAIDKYWSGEGSLLYGHSTADPVTTPPTLTELVIGGLGQLLEVARDSDDPNQATNGSLDPKWTALSLTEAMIGVWKYKRSGALKLQELPIGTLNQVLSVQRQSGGSGHGPYDPSSTDASPVYATNVDELAYQDIKTILGGFLSAIGDIAIGHGSSGDADVLGKGTDGQVLTSTASTIDWKDIKYALSKLLTTEGDLLHVTTISGVQQPARLAVGANHQIITTDGTESYWDNIDPVIKTLIPNNGDILVNHGGTITALPAATYVPSILVYWGGLGPTGYQWLDPPSVPSILIYSNDNQIKWLPTEAGSPQELQGSHGGFGWNAP